MRIFDAAIKEQWRRTSRAFSILCLPLKQRPLSFSFALDIVSTWRRHLLSYNQQHRTMVENIDDGPWWADGVSDVHDSQEYPMLRPTLIRNRSAYWLLSTRCEMHCSLSLMFLSCPSNLLKLPTMSKHLS